MTAFLSYLKSLPEPEAVDHVISCLKSGGEMAWDLMEIAHGKRWKCAPADLPRLVLEAIRHPGNGGGG